MTVQLQPRRAQLIARWVTYLGPRQVAWSGDWVTAQNVIEAIDARRRASGTERPVVPAVVRAALRDAVQEGLLETESSKGVSYFRVPEPTSSVSVDELHAAIAEAHGRVPPSILRTVLSVVRAASIEGVTLGEARRALADEDGHPASRGLVLSALVEGTRSGQLQQRSRVSPSGNSQDERKVWTFVHEPLETLPDERKTPRARKSRARKGARKSPRTALPPRRAEPRTPDRPEAKAEQPGGSDRGRVLVGLLRENGAPMTLTALVDAYNDRAEHDLSRASIRRDLMKAAKAGLVREAGTTEGTTGRPATLWDVAGGGQ